jgi:hypothetical protein
MFSAFSQYAQSTGSLWMCVTEVLLDATMNGAPRAMEAAVRRGSTATCSPAVCCRGGLDRFPFGEREMLPGSAKAGGLYH